MAIGITQPPHSRATAGTVLVHDGSPFGTQHTAFWVQRRGTEGSSAIRGENFSTGTDTAITRAGVLGTGRARRKPCRRVGNDGEHRPRSSGEMGVLGETGSFGVVGRASLGLIVDDPSGPVSAAGVLGQCNDGIGVHGVATTGWGIIGPERRSGRRDWDVVICERRRGPVRPFGRRDGDLDGRERRRGDVDTGTRRRPRAIEHATASSAPPSRASASSASPPAMPSRAGPPAMVLRRSACRATPTWAPASRATQGWGSASPGDPRGWAGYFEATPSCAATST